MMTSKILSRAMYATMITLGTTLTFTACDNNEPNPMTPENLVEIAAASPNFEILTSAIQSAELEEDLSLSGPFTVFAPVDAGFEDFLTANDLTAGDLLESPDLENILTYHVLSGEVNSFDVEAGSYMALNESQFYVSEDPSGDLWINGNAKIISTDIGATNGIIHALDQVIIPPSESIAEIAVASSTAAEPEFTQLVAALTRAGLVENVSGDEMDNLTVFAPTDAAFEELYQTLGVNGIDEIPVDQLTDVLLYHVVPARAFSQDLRQDASLPTLLEGESLTVDLANLQINESDLIPSSLNIHAVNGVIHGIDQVLLPPMEE